MTTSEPQILNQRRNELEINVKFLCFFFRAKLCQRKKHVKFLKWNSKFFILIIVEKNSSQSNGLLWVNYRLFELLNEVMS